MRAKEKPRILAVGPDPWYLVWMKKWFEDFFEVNIATSYSVIERELAGKRVDIIIIEGYGKEMAQAIQFRFRNALVCLLTTDPYITCNDNCVQCIQRPTSKNVALASISNLWLLHCNNDERAMMISKENKFVEVYRREPQERLEALHFRLVENPLVTSEGIVLRHDDHLDQINFCLPLQRGCQGNCRMCGTAKVKQNLKKFSSEEIASMWGHLLTSYKAFGCKNYKISTAFHGGGDPRFCLDELCESLHLIESRYGLNSRYIVTSIGGEEVFYQLFERLAGFHMSFELSAHSTNKPKRGWLMPATKNDSLSKMVELLANDSVKNHRKNKYRHMLIRGFNDSEYEADGIAKLVSGTPLRVILMSIEQGCLAQYPQALSEEEIKNFTQMLIDRGIDVCHNKNIGKGMVKCGMHIDVHDRQEVASCFIDEI